jgi:hypothetical protein
VRLFVCYFSAPVEVFYVICKSTPNISAVIVLSFPAAPVLLQVCGQRCPKVVSDLFECLFHVSDVFVGGVTRSWFIVD